MKLLSVCLFPFVFAAAGASTDLAVPVLRAGLSPRAIAAAGVAPPGVATMVTDMAASSAHQTGALAAADSTYTQAKVARDTLQRIVKRGQATPQQVLDFQQAKEGFANAAAARQAVLDALFTAATSGSSVAQRATLAQIRANARWKLPTEFLVVSRTQPQWVELRDLLTHEKVCAKLGWDPDPNYVSRLALLRAQPAVAAAKTRLDSTLAAVRAAWEIAVDV